MKRVWIIAAGLVILIAGAVVAYKLAFPTYSYRYRLMLEVDTPEGPKTGSSVIEARVRGQPQLLPEVGAVTSLEGEATYVDLGAGKNVVGLLANGNTAQDISGPVYLGIKAFGPWPCKEKLCQWQRIASASGARELPAELIPTLVTFGTAGDPKTARIIRPHQFEAVFGPGYSFKGARIEISSDPITHNITQMLPWLDGFSGVTGGQFDATWTHPGRNLYERHFRRTR